MDLQVVDKGRIDDDTPVTWVLNGESVDVLPDSAQAQEAADPNLLRCRLQEVLPLGDISLCTLVPERLPDQRIMLNLTGRLLRRMVAQTGQPVCLRLNPQALHITPAKPGLEPTPSVRRCTPPARRGQGSNRRDRGGSGVVPLS